MKFSDYHINDAIKKNLAELGFKRPTDIQFKSIPSIMKGEDVLAIAQTGTGKTAAFAIPINKKWSLFDLQRASDLIKKFDKPVISLNPLADGTLLKESKGAFSFLFDELKIYVVITKITSEGEAKEIVEVLKKFPSLIPPRKT